LSTVTTPDERLGVATTHREWNKRDGVDRKLRRPPEQCRP
jgi:hypothetical protein